jgi:nucleotide-binding universal stress UspA family protein
VYGAIVVGTDGSETAKRGVTEATALAEALGAELHIVSAYEPLRRATVDAPTGAKVWAVTDAEIRAIAEEAEAAARRRGVAVKAHALKGDPADALLRIAEQEKADLIVVGSRGMHGVSRILGSVPNKVSHRARCNVLIVATEDDDRA